MSRITRWLAPCALSEVTAIPVLAASCVGPPAGTNVEAALFAALLVASAALLRAGRAAGPPAPRASGRVVALAVIALAIAAADVRLLASDISSAASGAPYGLPGLLLVLAIGPLAEEIVYRGLLWRALVRRGAGVGATLAITSAAFALYHLAYWGGRLDARSLAHVATAAAAGLAFGWIRHRSGGIALPIVAHAAANTAVLWMRAAGWR